MADKEDRLFQLVLFNGQTHFSRLIQYCQKRQLKHIAQTINLRDGYIFSHAAILLKGSRMPSFKKFVSPDRFYLFESTAGGPSDIQAKSIFGVQVRDFEKVLQSLPATEKVAIVDFKILDNVEMDDVVLQQLINSIDAFILSSIGISYPISILKFLGAFFSKLRIDVGRTNLIHFPFPKTYFCSQLVSDFLKHLGMIPLSTESRSVLPMDFLGHDYDAIHRGGLPPICDVHTMKILSPSAILENLLSNQNNAPKESNKEQIATNN